MYNILLLARVANHRRFLIGTTTLLGSAMDLKLLREKFPPLRRPPVTTSIVNLIIDYLLQKELKPGDKLPTEIEFAEQLGVARNSVREAIKMLTSLGVIEVRRGVGTFISTSISTSAFNPLILNLVFDQGTSKELAEIRYLFEAGMAELMLERVTDADLLMLEEANEKIREAADNTPHDRRLLRERNINFHRQMMLITRNKLIVKMGTAVYTIYRAASERVVSKDPLADYKHHKKLMEFIRKKDRDALLDYTRKVIKWILEEGKKMKDK
jgi:GntR family transcriptional repressor for pyruvate dehydrogenase complex